MISLIEKDPALAGYEMNAMTKMDRVGDQYSRLDLEEIEIDKKIDKVQNILPWIEQSARSNEVVSDDEELYPTV